MVKSEIVAIGLNKKLAFIFERTNKILLERRSDKNVTVDMH